MTITYQSRGAEYLAVEGRNVASGLCRLKFLLQHLGKTNLHLNKKRLQMKCNR